MDTPLERRLDSLVYNDKGVSSTAQIKYCEWYQGSKFTAEAF
jgi:hypothetical protein